MNTIKKVMLTLSIGGLAAIVTGCAAPKFEIRDREVNPKYTIKPGTPEYNRAIELLKQYGIDDTNQQILNDEGAKWIGSGKEPSDFYKAGKR